MRMARKFLHRFIWICLVPPLGLAFGGSGHIDQEGKLELSPRRELLRKEGRESDHSLQEAGPAAFKEYRLTVSKTRQTGQSVFDISEIFLVDQAGEVIQLNTPNTVLSISNSQVISHDPRNLVDNNPYTSIELSTDQSITLKLQEEGVLVSGFGFKTSQNQAMDPTSFTLEGSMDGSAWYLLSQKAGYNTPDVRGALVGPFLVSKLAALALQGGDKTLPPTAFPKTLASGAVGAISKTVRRPFQAPASSLSTQSERKDVGTATMLASTMTSTLPVEAALPAAAPQVSTAVLDASKAAGLDDADTAATAAAVAAVESGQEPKASIEEQLKKAVMGAGLSAEQVAMVTAALRSLDPSHWSAVLSAWSAVAAKKVVPQSAGEKVAAVVSASGDAGFTVQEQAAASAQAAAAAAAAEAKVEAVAASPLKMVGQALEGAELPPEGKAAVADAASKELPENQEAVADVLRAAGVMATTSLPAVDAIADPGAKLIMKTVAEKLENATIDPVEKVSIANAAAEAYIKSMASTTSFDGIGMLVRAAEEAGLLHAQVKRLAETAQHLTVSEQLAAATALRAASEGPEVLSVEDPAEKVAAVVKAEAAAGVPEPEQAAAAAAAVTVAARKAKKAKLAEDENQIFTDIVSEALKIGLDEDQAEAILNVVASMRPDEQAVIDQFLMSLLNPISVSKPISVTMAPSTSPSTLASETGAVSTSGAALNPAVSAPGAAFTFYVVPSSGSRSSYKAETGLAAKGFVLGVALDVQGLVGFIQSKIGREVDPYQLSLAYGSFLFSWPSSEVAGCSDEESGFTDFQSITFYNATFANPGQSCGDLLASTMDLDGVLRFPSEGDTDLFRLAGMFGNQYETSGGDLVTLSILDLLIFEIKPSGEKVEYRVCGDSSGASYLGCPTKSPLKIKYPENSLGQGVKICSGQSHFHEYKLENCFPV